MDRLVIVPARSLDDLCQLAERAAQDLRAARPHDPLQDALQGAIKEIRTRSTLEPVG